MGLNPVPSQLWCVEQVPKYWKYLKRTKLNFHLSHIFIFHCFSLSFWNGNTLFFSSPLLLTYWLFPPFFFSSVQSSFRIMDMCHGGHTNAVFDALNQNTIHFSRAPLAPTASSGLPLGYGNIPVHTQVRSWSWRTRTAEKHSLFLFSFYCYWCRWANEMSAHVSVVKVFPVFNVMKLQHTLSLLFLSGERT